MRLLPAGLVLLAWAAATGRPQPKTPTAWAWVLAFALVDGAAFQVRSSVDLVLTQLCTVAARAVAACRSAPSLLAAVLRACVRLYVCVNATIRVAHQGFLAEGLQRTTAGLGSVIIDSQPLSVAVLAALLFGEALSPLGVAGLFMGVAGLLLLEVPPQMLQQATAALQSGGVAAGLGAVQQGLQEAATAAGSSSDGGGWSLTSSGEFWMLLAAQSMAMGTVMVR
jgi:drug/metabolite transporter (DMT)-like permease